VWREANKRRVPTPIVKRRITASVIVGMGTPLLALSLHSGESDKARKELKDFESFDKPPSRLPSSSLSPARSGHDTIAGGEPPSKVAKKLDTSPNIAKQIIAMLEIVGCSKYHIRDPPEIEDILDKTDANAINERLNGHQPSENPFLSLGGHGGDDDTEWITSSESFELVVEKIAQVTKIYEFLPNILKDGDIPQDTDAKLYADDVNVKADSEWSMPTIGEGFIYACGVFGIISLMKSKNLDVTLIDLSKEDYKEAYESVISNTPNGDLEYFPEAWCAHMNTLLTTISNEHQW
jgi:hypothetical protein